jgi:hypothetical protein
MRWSPLLLTALLCLGTAQFAPAQQPADDIIAGPPADAAQSEPNQAPEADALPADPDITPSDDMPTTPDDGIGATEQQPDIGQIPSSSDEGPAPDLGRTVKPEDRALPPAAVETPSPQDAVEPSIARPESEQAQQPKEKIAPPAQVQPDPDLAQPAPEDLQPAAAETQAVDAAQTNPNPLSGLQLDSLSATRSLPLFTPSRTPPVVAPPAEPEEVAAAPQEPPPAVEAQPPPLQLIGIILTDADQTALLRNTSTGETLRLASGDRFEDWTMKIVDARSIVFQSGDRVQDMKMFETFTSPPPPSGEPSGEPFDPGAPQEEPPADSGEPPPPDNGQSDIVIPHHANTQHAGPRPSSATKEQVRRGNSAETSDPDAQIPADPSAMTEDSAPPENFGPQLGNTPIPQEGALPDADQSDPVTSQ